ncbi:TetR/AcrR family transcriptional regulator [Planococcus sp. CP5-4]|uniref:TetR/AcrR family transcriptional regulator n=1 Tax=unclassified Planococcus (in: firmicutes) TaxID=2662419 RepID=UPI001C21C201|nr:MULTISPECIES: TetR/AcrR family transcriptional regulator [unclassified Planococcus (in: firmicutes)]MBU9671850.1 TetR/AcrR family transcriptional regulator [Planococcus sp. CP5-4_YE]MBV0909170.1 TetR/AcrR family transcriptional regulator [Planococcus sp. CP5-4_UN]MBW6063662.1 TetR/AcrR family transcriptional regulator [Planococcus sp. CP5-4]
MSKPNTKVALIEAASRLFRLHGYEGISLNDILKNSNIPKGSLYHYFPNGKEELAVAAIHHTKDIVLAWIEKSFEQTSNPVEAVQDHIHQLADLLNDETEPVGFPIGTIAAEKYSTNEPIRAACQSAFEEWRELYSTKFIEAGYSEKLAKDYGVFILAAIEGGILLSLTTKNVESLLIIADQIPFILSKREN